jgi:AcrR family transcriptional regulator
MIPDEKRQRRREATRQRQRQEILAAGLKLFAERGYHHVTIGDIAREAAYAVGMIYKLFPGKEELYRAIILELGKKFEEATAAGLAREGDAWQRVCGYLEAGSRIFRENSAAIRIYFAETHWVSFNFRAGLDRETTAIYERILAGLAQAFAAGIEEGLFRPHDPATLARAFVSMTMNIHFAWLEDPQNHPLEPGLEMVKDIFLHGITTAKKHETISHGGDHG